MRPGPVPPDDVPSAMMSWLAGFFAYLRGRSLTVGVGAELDLGLALEHLRLADRDAFRDACRAALAKSPSDLAVLDVAFDAYGSAMSSGVRTDGAHELAIPPSPPADGMPTSPANGRPTLAMDPQGVIHFGVYSPDAPPVGHAPSTLEPRRLAALRTGARQFRRLAGALPGRRFAPSERGRIDFRATARDSLAHGGEWLPLRRRWRRRLRSDLAVLWDVSGSMRAHDAALLALVYALQRVSRRARVFAFSTHLEEVTDRFRANPYGRAAEAMSKRMSPAGGGTRIGRCLQDFRRRYGPLVRGRTTVVILSDGWDLGDTRLVGRELDWLRHRAHMVAWVNPYARRPGFQPATSAMEQALPKVDVLLAPDDFESRRPLRTVRWSTSGSGYRNAFNGST